MEITKIMGRRKSVGSFDEPDMKDVTMREDVGSWAVSGRGPAGNGICKVHGAAVRSMVLCKFNRSKTWRKHLGVELP